MKSRGLVFLLSVFLWIVVPPPGQAGTPSDTLRMIFIGNSLTYTYDLPGQLRDLAASGGQTIGYREFLVGGATLEDHWNKRLGDIRTALQQGGWDYVVLQEYSSRPLKETEKFYMYARLFDAEIKNVGAQTLLFENWALNGRPEDITRLNTIYAAISMELGAPVIPLGQAWENVRRARPTFQLFEDDRHPTREGTYLNACVFYGSLYGESPEGLSPLDVNPSDAAFLQMIAWQTVRDAGDDPSSSRSWADTGYAMMAGAS